MPFTISYNSDIKNIVVHVCMIMHHVSAQDHYLLSPSNTFEFSLPNKNLFLYAPSRDGPTFCMWEEKVATSTI